MHLVYLATSIVPSKAANSIQVMKMCHAFANHGHEVDLIIPSRPEKETEVDDIFSFYDINPNFEITKIPYFELTSVGTFISSYLMARKAAQFEPDLVYGRNVIACSFASSRGFPTVFETHAPITQGRFGKVKQYFFNRLLGHEQTTHLVTISDALKDHYETEYSHFDGDIVVARDGADAVDESTQPIDLDVSGDRFQIGYIGHLYQGRGMNLIAALASRCPHVDFHIIGGDDEAVKYWRGEIDHSENVTFYGFLSPSELDQYRLAFDVLLAPYQRDLETRSGYNTLKWMSPLKIFEYMAAGRPIVASELSAIEEILIDGETALLCDPDDTSEWVNSIRRLQNDPQLQYELGNQAKSEFLSEYTWEVRTRKILDFISDQII
ncbi:glycosyltransferase family 4 protein [Natronoglomus mannanivorans]|uniref:Glycosyltransferase family 4 protein n=1 Tax=Natronoglomus mannanivorans TaxID=2979990 RepID=A0AAP2Z2A7_9EURY|nr:glycosyltransferase family 4 protein [Halobacteria archaeon AArc-xg1-1]